MRLIITKIVKNWLVRNHWDWIWRIKILNGKTQDHSAETAIRRCSVKKLFLKISQVFKSNFCNSWEASGKRKCFEATEMYKVSHKRTSKIIYELFQEKKNSEFSRSNDFQGICNVKTEQYGMRHFPVGSNRGQLFCMKESILRCPFW